MQVANNGKCFSFHKYYHVFLSFDALRQKRTHQNACSRDAVWIITERHGIFSFGFVKRYPESSRDSAFFWVICLTYTKLFCASCDLSKFLVRWSNLFIIFGLPTSKCLSRSLPSSVSVTVIEFIEILVILSCGSELNYCNNFEIDVY